MKRFLFIICLVSSSCASAYLSPSVKFKNSSPDGAEIKNIRVEWSQIA